MSEEKDSPRVASLKNQWELNRKAKKRIRVVGGKVETYEAKPTAETLEEAVARERLARPGIGQKVEGKGIFLGAWAPKDRQGKSLGEIFNVYAAPQDLTDNKGDRFLLTYKDAIAYVPTLKNWYGHNGTSYANDQELYQSIKDGSYKGGWFIPPRELLNGNDLLTYKVQKDNLYAYKDTGAFKGTFCTDKITTILGSDFPSIYLSSTCVAPASPENKSTCVWTTRFAQGADDWYRNDISRMACRLVRMEPRT